MSQSGREGGDNMGQMIEYEKLMTEIVYINLPGPEEPIPGMNGPDLIHGFLADLYKTKKPGMKAFIDSLCSKWSIHYREKKR
jgi:hypothetical protein